MRNGVPCAAGARPQRQRRARRVQGARSLCSGRSSPESRGDKNRIVRPRSDCIAMLPGHLSTVARHGRTALEAAHDNRRPGPPRSQRTGASALRGLPSQAARRRRGRPPIVHRRHSEPRAAGHSPSDSCTRPGRSGPRAPSPHGNEVRDGSCRSTGTHLSNSKNGVQLLWSLRPPLLHSSTRNGRRQPEHAGGESDGAVPGW